MSTSVSIATALAYVTFLWTVFLIYDVRRRPNPPPGLRQLGLFCHNIPALCLLGTTFAAQYFNDTYLVWFVAVMVFRYCRLVVNIFFWFQYEPSVGTADLKLNSSDCTVVVPTVGPEGNKCYGDMVAAILVNRPAQLTCSTNTAAAAQEVESTLPAIVADVEAGITAYQMEHGLGAVKIATPIVVLNADVSNKRQQVVHAFSKVKTDILVMVDDTAIWHPQFLQATLPAFQSEKVGIVGTRK